MELVILNAPKFDEPTTYSHDWSREVKGWLEDKGYVVIDISGRETSRSEVEEALKNHPKAFFIHYNHGNEDKIWGSKTEAVVDLNNVDLLRNRPVYCMNCLSAQKLGVEVWKRGCVFYYGYVEVFSFSTESLKDFQTFANYGVFLYLEGEEPSQMLSKAKEKGKELVAKLASEGKYLASILMSQDTDALHCWNGEEPEAEVSRCFFRRMTVRLFGKRGWFISRSGIAKNILKVVFFVFFPFYGWWQLDLWAGPKFDWTRSDVPREVLPFWYMHEADGYVMFFCWFSIPYLALLAFTLRVQIRFAYRKIKAYLVHTI